MKIKYARVQIRTADGPRVRHFKYTNKKQIAEYVKANFGKATFVIHEHDAITAAMVYSVNYHYTSL